MITYSRVCISSFKRIHQELSRKMQFELKNVARKSHVKNAIRYYGEAAMLAECQKKCNSIFG